MKLFVKSSSNWILLDLLENNPIKLTMSVSDIMEPTESPSTFSQTFRVPNTANNELFFKSAFNINAVTFDPTKKIEAYIDDSSVIISVGSIQLSNIITNNKDRNSEYEVTFFGEVSDFASKIGSGFLNSLNLSQYNHQKTYVNVVNSWYKVLFNGDVLYPLIEWGYDYLDGQPVQNTLSLYDNLISKKGFTSNNQPLSIDQFKPVIRAKVLIDAIFKSSGFTYESTFLNGSDFMNQYVITEQTDTAVDRKTPKFQAKGINQQNLNIGLTNIFLPNEIYDTANSFDPTNSTFTVPLTFPNPADYYTFTFNGGVRLSPIATSVTFTLQVFNLTTSTIIATQTYTYSPPNSTFVFNFNHTFNIFNSSAALGHQLIFRINASGFISGLGVLLSPTITQNTSIDNINVLNNYLPNNIKTLDFLKAIIQRFNLVLEPSKTKEKHFIITPWVNWVSQGIQRDWTSFVDGNIDLQSKPLFNSQTRANTWLDDEDSDYVNYNFQTATKTTYGQLDLDSQIELLTGKTVTQSLFSPTPLLPIGNASSEASATPNQKLAARFLIPHIAKDTTTERTPITPKLRLVYYNGMINAPLNWHIKNDANTIIPWNQYPLVSQYSQFNTINFIDLAWRNAAPLWDNNSIVTNPEMRTPNDLWNTYWRKWYDFTFDKFGRILEMNIILDYKKIWDLKFNDKIFIKDSWFMINKITDYVVGQPTSCKVELVRVGESISITPQLIITGDSMSFLEKQDTDCDVFCLFENGGETTTYYKQDDFLYLDQEGLLPAQNGYYSYGAENTFAVDNGVIIEYFDTSGCSCAAPTVYLFDRYCAAETQYDASCCGSPGGAFYGTEPQLYNCPRGWQDAAMTIPIADGWYHETEEDYVAQFINGINVQVGFVVPC